LRWCQAGHWSVTKYLVDCANDILNADLGFNEIAIGAKGFAASALIFAAECGHHDYFDAFGFGC
jgi:hypothetical protein